MKREDALHLANRINFLHIIRGHEMDTVDYCTFIEWLENCDTIFENSVVAYKEFTGGKKTDRIYSLHAPKHIYDEYLNREP